MAFTSNSVPYLEQVSQDAVKQRDWEKIEAAIRKSGYWEESWEWRISTTNTLRIQPERHNNQDWFTVSVTCGEMSMSCHTRTLERAAEFAGVFDKLIRDLFWTLDWPGNPGPRD